jgi:hypothetical protein
MQVLTGAEEEEEEEEDFTSFSSHDQSQVQHASRIFQETATTSPASTASLPEYYP